MATIYRHPAGDILVSNLPGSDTNEEAAAEATRWCERLKRARDARRRRRPMDIPPRRDH